MSNHKQKTLKDELRVNALGVVTIELRFNHIKFIKIFF